LGVLELKGIRVQLVIQGSKDLLATRVTKEALESEPRVTKETLVTEFRVTKETLGFRVGRVRELKDGKGS
jgi:hypothetical protein